MSLWESAGTAVRALCANTLRSLLTVLGIVVGVGAVIAMVAVGEGAQLRVAEQIRSLGSNLLMVLPGAPREGGVRRAIGSAHTLTEADAAAIRSEVQTVSVAAPAVRRGAQIVRGNRNWSTIVNGTTLDYFVAREWPVASGRTITAEEVDTAAKSALLGASVAHALFAGRDPIGELVRVDDVPFSVVGVLDRKGPSGTGNDQDDIVFVPISTAKLRLMGGARRVNPLAVAYVLVKVDDASHMQETARAIESLLRQRHRIQRGGEDDFEVRNPAAAMSVQREASRALTILLAAIASVSLLVGGISIMNIMLVSVTERTREIGLRMAVGARRRDIRNQFLIEAVTLCVIGGVIGVALGAAGAATVARIAGWPIFISVEAAALAVGFAAAVGVFFGFYPALKASRLAPIDALRIE